MINKIRQGLKHLNIRVSEYDERPAIDFMREHFKGKGVTGCEIGVYEGINALRIIRKLNIERLHLIDPYEPYQDKYNDYTEQKLKMARQKAKDRLIDNTYKINWSWHKSIEEIKDYELDFAYIDGKHTYKAVMDDLNAVYPLVKGGGVIAGHDIILYDVIKALINFCDNRGIEPSIKGWDFWFVKSKRVTVTDNGESYIC